MPRHLLLSLVAILSINMHAAHAVDAPDPEGENTGGVGDLLVAPTRVVLEGKTRAAEVILNNTGSKEATYRIELIQLHMDENGTYRPLAKDELGKYGEKSAEPMLRFSPHQVTLKPKESQTVKIMLRKVEGASGEYRSHLSFHANPEMAEGEDVEAKPAEDGKISIKLIPVYGVSIPVIVRQGDLSAQAGITNFKAAGRKATLTLTRSGSKSLYGDLLVSAGAKVIGELRGVGVLLPNTKRNITIDLTEEAGSAITAEYRARAEEGGGTLAKATLP